MPDIVDAVTSGLASGFRAIASNSPIILAIGSSLGLSVKMAIDYCSKSYGGLFFTTFSQYHFSYFIVISVGFLCVPILFGRSAFPWKVSERIVTVQKIMSLGGFTKAQQRAYWADLLKVYIQSIGDESLKSEQVIAQKHPKKPA